MARQSQEHLVSSDSTDLSPQIDHDELIAIFERIVHWSDSPTSRRAMMAAIDFPVDDVSIFLVVNQLVYRGAMHPKDLADSLGMGRPNISKLSARAVELGLVVRVAHSSDDRSILLALSESGRAIGAKITNLLRSGLMDLLDSWDPSEVIQFEKLLKKYITQVEAKYPITKK